MKIHYKYLLKSTTKKKVAAIALISIMVAVTFVSLGNGFGQAIVSVPNGNHTLDFNTSTNSTMFATVPYDHSGPTVFTGLTVEGDVTGYVTQYNYESGSYDELNINLAGLISANTSLGIIPNEIQIGAYMNQSDNEQNVSGIIIAQQPTPINTGINVTEPTAGAASAIFEFVGGITAGGLDAAIAAAGGTFGASLAADLAVTAAFYYANQHYENYIANLSQTTDIQGTKHFYQTYDVNSTAYEALAQTGIQLLIPYDEIDNNQVYNLTLYASSHLNYPYTFWNTTITTIEIKDSSSPTYSVTFEESGLQAGASWSASIGVYSESGSSTSVTVLKIPSGSYTWEVPDVDINESNGDIYEYSASPASGNITIDANGTVIPTTFSYVGIVGHWNCVNGTTEILLANGSYIQADNPAILGAYVETYNVTTHSYDAEEVEDVYVTHLTEQYTINNMLEVSALEPILTNHGYVNAQNLTYRDMIYDTLTGSYVHVTQISINTGNFTMYDFYIPPNLDFIAGQFVVYDESA
ncbi:MAG: hypothetical protein M0Z77_11395 [Thermoplasmatales archaeon]|nr:hypothetical protein [Candidatus Thermoplasmatota archaeon]MDA8056233.1 hypothetical protein [Thermoplasmatales archaeon]